MAPRFSSSLNAIALTAFGGLVFGLSVTAARAVRVHLSQRSVAQGPASSGLSKADSAGDGGQASAGKLAYAVSCARCHGPEGRGDGPDAINLPRPPRDFATSEPSLAVQPDRIRKAILEGIPGTAMAPWSGSLRRVELDALVTHVQMLAQQGQPAEPSSPETMALLEQAGFLPAPGQPQAPVITLADLAGNRQTLQQLQGKLTLLAFWATNCAPCLEEMPALEQLAMRFRADGLAVVPICVDRADAATVANVIRSKTKTLPTYLDPEGLSLLRFGGQLVPHYVLLDQRGRILGTGQGARSFSSRPIDHLIQHCLGMTHAEK
jgi:thiol-disulfide isomerase/thioredoxin